MAQCDAERYIRDSAFGFKFYIELSGAHWFHFFVAVCTGNMVSLLVRYFISMHLHNAQNVELLGMLMLPTTLSKLPVRLGKKSSMLLRLCFLLLTSAS